MRINNTKARACEYRSSGESEVSCHSSANARIYVHNVAAGSARTTAGRKNTIRSRYHTPICRYHKKRAEHSPEEGLVELEIVHGFLSSSATFDDVGRVHESVPGQGVRDFAAAGKMDREGRVKVWHLQQSCFALCHTDDKPRQEQSREMRHERHGKRFALSSSGRVLQKREKGSVGKRRCWCNNTLVVV